MAAFFVWMVAATSASIVHCVPPQSSVAIESRLVQHLMRGYMKEALPVLKVKTSVNVSMQVSFVGVDDVDENKNIFTATLLLAQLWKDPRLAWNASEYGGMGTIRLPVDKLWIPDIVPYNTAGMYGRQSRYDEIAHVLSDGSVFWVPLWTIASKCPMDMSSFPFDTQQCPMILGSWVHSRAEMMLSFMESPSLDKDLALSGSDFSSPSHPTWELIRAVASIKSVNYTCCEDFFETLTVKVHISRRSTFYRFLAVGPAAVFGLLVPLLFLIPSSSDGKTTYGMLIMLSLTVLILALEEAIPFSHNNVPKIGYFYLGTMALCACSVMLSIFVSNMGQRGVRHKPLPGWLKWLCLSRFGFRRFFCIDNYEPVENVYSVSLKNLWTPERTTQTSLDPESSAQPEATSDMDDIRKCLHYLVGQQSAEVTSRNVRQDWVELARVFDRILFVVFLVLYVLFAVNFLT
ncbi:neuronal acetylcholine receptor subunit alpha-2-like [Haliotis rufescens]|uniref:neuronal acetylcholine receptor subunit alpha-2-like n=1 Tax=Haliotis rufescens TaxID=6454 RepID=UPI00201F0D5E|nr:neuronal acetylcholine receptor subunit alpha-2-like [Haliotis rufescens]